ncbi:MAG TPA: heavy metal-associated domain-containing protein [Tepidisphaeraceae bacterium]|jgi:copper chaperone CopZ
MGQNVTQDQLAIIRIEGMHCHRCEEKIQTSLGQEDGVNEVEVDFLSGQASVLFDAGKIDIARLVERIEAAGYRTAGYSKSGAPG